MRAAGVELRLMQSFTDAHRVRGGWQVEGLGRTHWLVGAEGAKSRVAARTGLGRVRDFLYGIEHEYVGARLDEPDALPCFLGDWKSTRRNSSHQCTIPMPSSA